MAYHQARGRDPLIDSSVKETLERRGVELLGIAMMIIGVVSALIIYSYSPSDPGPFSASDAPVQNLLGIMGATIASPLFLILGWGSWSLVALFLVWGVRMTLHRGSERATSRTIFAPIGVALVAIYAATLVPDETWTHSFGLGGVVRGYSSWISADGRSDRCQNCDRSIIRSFGNRYDDCWSLCLGFQ